MSLPVFRPSFRSLLGLVAVALIASAAGPAWAQSQATTGVIEGTVVDADGAVLPGATVTLTNTATNYTQVVTSSSNGRFRAPLLPLGPYRVTVELQGFATMVREGIDVSVGQRVNLAFEMQLSTVEESITVTAEKPLIETTRTEGATRIDDRQIQGLPNNGRNFLDFSLLTPGVAIVQGPDGDELSINGQKGIQNNVSVDGADFNNPFFGEQRGGQRPPFTFNLDAIEEVVVVADGANAEFGRSSGGFVNVVTKSGTNEFHGSANFFFKDDSLSADARKADDSTESFDFDQQQVGFTLGGPIRRDEIFFFVAGDLQRGRSTKQTDPSRIEPRVVDALAALGSPDENGPIDRTDDARVFLFKTDWRLSQNHNLTLRYAYTWSEQENGTFDVDSWGRSANAIERDFSNAVSGQVASTLSERVYNEFRFQVAREDRPRPYNGPNLAGQNRPLPDIAFDFAEGYRFGMPFFIPVEYYDSRVQFNDNVSILTDNHSIKLGGEYNRVNSVQTFIGFANGRFIFSSTDGFLNYVANPNYVECSDGSSSQTGTCPAGTSVVGPVLLYLQQAGVGDISVEEAGTQSIPQNEIAFFAQDDWVVNNHVSLNYGLRWEAQVQPDMITPPDEVFYAPFIGQTRFGQEFPSDGTIPSDLNMWQPRFGISIDPRADGRTVIRGTAGVYAARIPGLNLASSRSTNGSRGQTLFRNSALTPILGAPPPIDELIPQDEIGIPFFPSVFVFDKDFENPKTLALSASVEHEVVEDLALLLKYNYAKTDHLTRFVNRNDPLLGSPWSFGLPPFGINGIGTLTVVESTAKSKYWGVTVGARKRFSDNYAFHLNYTYSKDRSDDDNERDPFTFRYAKVTDLDAEWGFSDRDQRHRLNGSFLARLPYDVDFNARYSYRSAQPVSIHFNGPGCEQGCIANTPQDRINPDGTVTQRNLGRKDNEFSSLDFRLSKTFVTAGGWTFEPSFEVFNLFDTKNILRPATTNLVFNFDGTVTSGAGQPRQMQLGMRVVW